MDSHNPPSYLFMPRNTNTLVPRVNFILRFVFSRFSYSDFRDEFLDPIRVNKETRSPTVSGFTRECIPRRKSIESFPLLDIDIRHYVPSSAKPLLSSKYFDCSWARCNFLPASFPFPPSAKFNLSISKILPSRDEKFSRLVGNRLSSKSVYRYMNFFLSFIIIIIFFLRISFNQRCFRLQDREEEIERELKRKRKES